MAKFTIETTYRLPVYRQRTYDAGTLEDACRLAVADDDWAGSKEDHESAGETYVTGAWPSEIAPYSVHSLPAWLIPEQFCETVQRKADHFEVLLGILKILAHAHGNGATGIPFWRRRADSAIAKAEAILEGAPDPA